MEADLMDSKMMVQEKKYTRDSTPEIEELRRLRNEYTNKASEYQKEIDKKIIELHNVPDFTGKWLKKTGSHEITICNVEEVKRLVYGISVWTNQMCIVGDGTFFLSKYGERIMLDWDEIDKLVILSNEEAKNEIRKYNDIFLKS